MNLATAMFRLAKGCTMESQNAEAALVVAQLLEDIRANMKSFGAQAVANTAWAFARMRVTDGPLLVAARQAAVRQSPELNPRGLSNIAWAFATLECLDTPASAALAAAARCRV